MTTTAPATRLANFIDGVYEAPASGAYLDAYEPATGRVRRVVKQRCGRQVATVFQREHLREHLHVNTSPT